MLSGMVDVPGRALKVVDAFCTKGLFGHPTVASHRTAKRETLGSQQAPDRRGNWGIVRHRQELVS